MNRRIFPITILVIIAIALIAAGIGAFDIPDAYYYNILGTFLLKGTLTAVWPFNVTNPATLYSPAYSVFLAWFLSLGRPWSTFFIPFIQLGLVAVSAALLYRIMRRITAKPWAAFTAILFVLLPFNLLYATALMSETMAMFWVTVLLFIVTDNISHQPRIHPSFVVCVASILTLTRNAFVLVLPISIAWWAWNMLQNQTVTKRILQRLQTGANRLRITKKNIHLTKEDNNNVDFGKREKSAGNHLVVQIIQQTPAILGLIAVLWWLSFNHRYHGVRQLTVNSGRHIYNNVVHAGHLLPPKNSAIWQEFTKRVPEDMLFEPEYNLHRFFADDMAARTLDEVAADRMFLRFATAAIANNPAQYPRHLVNIFWGDLTTPPYYRYVLNHLGFKDPNCPDCMLTNTCRVVWDRGMCSPLFSLPAASSLWASWISVNLAMYPLGMAVLAALATLGGIRAVIKKRILVIIVAVSFVVFAGTVAAAQRIEGRYLIPLYPLYAILISEGVQTVISGLRPKRTRLVKGRAI